MVLDRRRDSNLVRFDQWSSFSWKGYHSKDIIANDEFLDAIFFGNISFRFALSRSWDNLGRFSEVISQLSQLVKKHVPELVYLPCICRI